MSLQDWVSNGWLRPHKTTVKEISSLLEIVERDLHDSKKDAISADWQFGIAYNAALKLCTILLYAEGFRPEKNLAHYRTLQSLPEILGKNHKDDAEYLETCRTKRNIVEYEYVGGATEDDSEELISYVEKLRKEVLDWLKIRHPKLIEEKSK